MSLDTAPRPSLVFMRLLGELQVWPGCTGLFPDTRAGNLRVKTGGEEDKMMVKGKTPAGWAPQRLSTTNSGEKGIF